METSLPGLSGRAMPGWFGMTPPTLIRGISWAAPAPRTSAARRVTRIIQRLRLDANKRGCRKVCPDQMRLRFASVSTAGIAEHATPFCRSRRSRYKRVDSLADRVQIQILLRIVAFVDPHRLRNTERFLISFGFVLVG